MKIILHFGINIGKRNEKVLLRLYLNILKEGKRMRIAPVATIKWFLSFK